MTALERSTQGNQGPIKRFVIEPARKLFATVGLKDSRVKFEEQTPKVTIIHIPREVREERLNRVLGSSLAETLAIKKAEKAAEERLAEFKAAAMSEYWRCHPRPY